MEITNDMIDRIITCQKIITKPPKCQMQETNSNLRNDMELSSEDGQEHFSVFLRQNKLLPDHFSIGLIWKNAELNKSITVLRCNGPHGGNLKFKEHFKPHIHKITADDIQNECFKPTINNTEITTNYNTFEEAVMFFCTFCGINNAHIYFPWIMNQSLF